MFEGVFEVFNCTEQGSLILKNPKICFKVAINYLESLKVYRMFEGVFEVFNCTEQGSLILKNPKICSKLQ